jgi:PKD repeat protein
MKNLKLALLTLLLPLAAFAQPQITTTSLQGGKVGQHYYRSIYATEPAEWSIESGSLPPDFWLGEVNSCESDGNECRAYSIHGTFTTAGEYTFTLKATNAAGSDTKTFTINVIMPQAPQITTNSPPDGKVGQYYSEYIYATDYAEWSVASGSLPPGLSLRVGSCDVIACWVYIAGILTKAGEYTFTLKATNVAGSNTKTFTINVIMPPAPRITTTSLPDGKVGQYYGTQCYGTCCGLYVYATEPAEWSIVGGNLPPGLELGGFDDENFDNRNYISGTQLTAAGTYTFTLKATNAAGSDTKTFTINVIMPQAPIITTENFPDSKAGQHFYGQRIEATDYAEWSVINGSLPPGLSLGLLEDRGIYYGYIAGKPTAVGTYTFTLKATNVAGSDTKTFTINIIMPQVPVITTVSLSQDVKVGQHYYRSIYATEPAEWSIESGSLPPGFLLGENSCESDGVCPGRIDGFPTVAGEYTFTVKAMNAAGSDTKTFTINIIMPQVPVITTETLPEGKAGIYYSYYLQYKSQSSNIYATEPAVWSIESGSLPPGLELSRGAGSYCDSNGCHAWIDGIPTAAGTYTFTLKATNVAGSGTKEFTINIIMLEVPMITTETLPEGKVEQQYHQEIEAADYAVWSIESGELPPGLSLWVAEYDDGNFCSSGRCYISGFPTEAGEYTFTLKTENETGVDTKQLLIKINPASTPIRLPQIGGGSIRIQATANSIVLENLPRNAKVEVFNLHGKQVYSNHSVNSHMDASASLVIPVQTKGIYVIKANSQTMRTVVR